MKKVYETTFSGSKEILARTPSEAHAWKRAHEFMRNNPEYEYVKLENDANSQEEIVRICVLKFKDM